MTTAVYLRVDELRHRLQCGVRIAHVPHHHCHGLAPELCNEQVLSVDDANATDWVLLVKREGLDVANAFYPPHVGMTTARS